MPRDNIINPKGRSLDPQVRRLADAIGEMRPGMFWTHEQLAGMMGEVAGTNRYRSVIHKWKRLVKKEQRLVIEARRGDGYETLTPRENLGYAARRTRSGMLRVRESKQVAQITADDGLSDAERHAKRHLVDVNSAIEREYRVQQKQAKGLMALLATRGAAVKQLPPPKGAG